VYTLIQVAKKLKPLKVMFPSKLRNVGWLDHTYVDEVMHTTSHSFVLFDNTKAFVVIANRLTSQTSVVELSTTVPSLHLVHTHRHTVVNCNDELCDNTLSAVHQVVVNVVDCFLW
jgi:hypothetical protein